MRQRSTLFRFLCAALLTLAAAVLLARTALLEIEAHTANTNLFMRHRLREMVAALPQIAQVRDPVALVFGASDMEIEFHPDEFDAEMAKKGKKMTSFNLAVRNGAPVFSEIVNRVEQNGIRPEIAIVKFSPTFFTKTAKRLWNVSDDIKSSLAQGHELIATRFLFDGMSPSMARFYVSDWFNSWRQFKMSDGSPLLFRNRDLNGGVAWDFSKRGFFYFGWPHQPQLDEVLKDYRRSEVQAAVLAYHRRCCDSEGLHFDASLLHDFTGSMREVTRISKKTFLLYYPDNIPRSEEAKLRLLQTLEMVAQQSGAELLNVENIFSDNDFVDPIHLSLEGGAKLSRKMAELIP